MKYRLVDLTLVLILVSLPFLGIFQACKGNSAPPTVPGDNQNKKNSDKGNNRAPVAVVSTIEVEEGATPFTVHLDGSSSRDPDGQPLKYTWRFSDGTEDDKAVIDHTFESSGKFTAQLTVADEAGLDADSEPVTVYSWGLANSPWPKFGHDERNSGVSEFQGPKMNLHPGKDDRAFARRWRSGIEEAPINAICVGYEGKVFYTQGRWLRARTAEGGVLWDRKFDSVISVWPAIAHDGSIVLATREGRAYRVSSFGQNIWSIDLNKVVHGAVYPSIAIAIGHDGTIYIPCPVINPAGVANDGTGQFARLVALTFDGKVRWTNVLDSQSTDMAPAITPEGNVLVNAMRGCLYKPDGSLIRTMDYYYSDYYDGKTLAVLGPPTISPKGWIVFNNAGLPMFTPWGSYYMDMAEDGDPGHRNAAIWGSKAVEHIEYWGDSFNLTSRTTAGDLHSFKLLDNSDWSYYPSEEIGGAVEDSIGHVYTSCYGLRGASPISYSSLYPYAPKRYSLWTYPPYAQHSTAPVIGDNHWLYVGVGNDILAVGD